MRNSEQVSRDCTKNSAIFYEFYTCLRRNLFSVEIYSSSLILTRGGFGEFETVMQTRDEVEGLHNFREFSQPPECLDEAM